VEGKKVKGKKQYCGSRIDGEGNNRTKTKYLLQPIQQHSGRGIEVTLFRVEPSRHRYSYRTAATILILLPAREIMAIFWQ
jgi:hypothetical protein